MSQPGQSNQLRIIGGQWRGRKLRFADGRGLRPTPDRVRETLFNWLMPYLHGARCLDLFTGSGALGLEALSRAAAQVTMIDSNAKVIAQIKQNLELLEADNAQLLQADGVKWLQQPASQVFDIVFLDPPYADKLLPACIELLEEQGWLADEAWVYIELPSAEALPALPANWSWHRNKQAGQVGYHLAKRGSA
jgi:16S rRNA (guanine966-N2)-methyltransferase